MINRGEFQDKLPDGVSLGVQIHDGGQRKVFEADDGGEKVVIKLMPEEDRNRAEREVAIGSTFDHPNLPRILDTEVFDVELEGEEFVWFRERFIEGETLEARGNGFDPCEALSLAADLAAAVTYLWERHTVVHRDIKPINIMVRPEGSFVLIDVGIGRHQTESSITSGLLGPGTRGHVAPEQMLPNKGRKLDSRTDLFLIGIVVYQVLVGVRPFRPERPDYETKLMAGEWPRPDGLPKPVADLLERLLGNRPHQRPSLAQATAMIDAARKELECS
ncbi:MAG TPA: protein kinase [Solirubrobacterales bacterium]|nr:protein kinase [Solirubrobacterales bacterium]